MVKGHSLKQFKFPNSSKYVLWRCIEVSLTKDKKISLSRIAKCESITHLTLADLGLSFISAISPNDYPSDS
jgi:hypothetical protein